MRLDEIASRLDCKLEGSGETEITGVAGMDEAKPTELTFLANPKYRAKLKTTRAGAVILGPEEGSPGRPVLRSGNPYLTFARALELFSPPPRPKPGIHPSAIVAPDVKIGRNPSIGPYVVIEDGVELGDDCEIKSFVVIYRGAKIGDRFLAHAHAIVRENVQIGDDVILQNGAVIGGDGFGFAKQADGSYYKIVQAGTAVLEDRVEVQTNSCIDRGTIGETRLRRGAKVDNLVQVGHGCEVGENTLLCGQAGLAGTCKVGRNVVIAGQAGASGHLTIGDNAVVTPQSGVPSDVEAGKIVSGSPVIDHYQWLKWASLYGKVPGLFSTVRKLRDEVESLQRGK
jgi:UDP-3-O-[3-hydroxymyristoyl] glucosamine N-acyltransferase